MEIYVPETETRRYWAREQDPRKFVDALRDRVTEYSEVITRNRLMARIMRSWRYYHGLFFEGAFDYSETAIKALGQQGELAGLAVNDFRSLMQQVKAMITKQRVSVDLLAKSSDIAALTQARLGKLVIEDYAQRAETFYDTAVEHALIFNVGYLVSTWDEKAGEEYDGSPETGEIYHAGDVKYSTPTIFDVIYDPHAQCWDENQWVLIRKRENRYDLAARQPDLEDKILGMEGDHYDAEDSKSLFSFNTSADAKTDKMDVWCFYHKPSDALPEGRYAEFFAHELLPDYEDAPLPYKDLPVDRVTAGEMLLTCFGYSPALDMQGPQEALNAETSTVASNHKAFGVVRVWCEEGDVPKHQSIAEGLSVLISQKKPEILDFSSRGSAEQFKFRSESRQDMQLISGINDVHRGNPEGQLKSGSGAAFAFLDAKAVEANSPIQKSYDKMVEGSLTKTIRYLDRFTQYPHFMAIPGKFNRPYQVLIQRDNFSSVDRVMVRRRNPILDTTAGKFQIAELLLQQKRVTNEEFLTFLQTGNFDPMLESANAQLSLVREENEQMLEGKTDIKILAIDDHVLHVKEHSALLNTTESRNNPQLASIVLAHVMSHLQALMIPSVQMHQVVLGYDVPLPAMPQLGVPGAQGQIGSPRPGSMGAGPNEPGMPMPAQNKTALGTRSEAA